MKETRGNRLHIGVYGRRNVGKSSLVNAIFGQEFSIVSDTAGTTTDVNQKAMELLPFGPVLLMDTAGFDDKGTLGTKRIESTKKTLERADIAIFVCDNEGLTPKDIDFLSGLEKRKIPTLLVVNKTDISIPEVDRENTLKVSLKKDKNITAKIKQALIELLPEDLIKTDNAIEGLVQPKDTIVLVIPIDKEAPKGRLILPQVQTLRNLLDESCISIVCKESELQAALDTLKTSPKLVITDSQAFKSVSEIVPREIPLTSFSILFARLKGDLTAFIEGADAIDKLKDGDKVLICESCTHHAIEDDIGRVKIPALVKKYTGKEINFEHYSGHDFPQDIAKYSLIIHCGACMTNRKEVLSRIYKSKIHGVAITNYGIAIAKCLGILERAVKGII